MSEMEPSSLGLRRIDLLQGLSVQRLNEISKQCAWRNYRAGQRLVSREAADRDLHMIVAGTVRVTSYSAAGRETSFRDLEAGTSYGELSALDGCPRSVDVVAIDSALIASLSPADFKALLREEWVVNERVLLRLTDLVRRLTDRVLDLSTLTVQQRICRELLRLAAKDHEGGAVGRIDPAPKHAELASLVSTYREQITREISALVKMGVLSKDGNALVVNDVVRLERIAGSDPAA
ncbi:Crp/Fnr family transcriptional regulator [Ramlibacter rhizophilus]|uniref:Crp/Fnr family transcriptional regulator n=1 Tax=Ramlibacter rhizophilus TaxID=1781167 RepID=A0A4Z0BGS8_9BURK|nr:Crp/Fnr family transcriptional regulator [Ramlibacter rhizophilus]TFY97467.1 Crp/Fnr family transcriptional regulator [Ramlibacter rhizophilus]